MGEVFKQFSVQTIARPDGYQFPLGLDTLLVDTTANANVATNTTGGTQTIDGDYAVHSFTTSGEFIPSADLTVEWGCKYP